MSVFETRQRDGAGEASVRARWHQRLRATRGDHPNAVAARDAVAAPRAMPARDGASGELGERGAPLDRTTDVHFERSAPPAPSYRALCDAVGWRTPSLDASVRALAGSQASVSGWLDGELVCFGRLVGDGALHWCIVDVMVHPRLQGNGLGTRVIESLQSVVADSGAGAVALVAAPKVTAFYERLGYVRSPNSWLVRRVR